MDSESFCQKALFLRKTANYEDSIFYYEKSIRIDPSYAPAWNGIGTAYKYLKKFSKAMSCYDRALKLDPQFESAAWNKCLLHLLLGNYKKGKPRYGWFRPGYPLSGVAKIKEEYAQPIWDGKKLNGTLLLNSQHGLGDVINFIRYAVFAKSLCKKVIVETHTELKSLLQTCPYIDEVYSLGEDLPSFDAQMEIVYLPFVFKQIPDTPYLFPSNLLGIIEPSKKINIGIVWKGNPNHPNDNNRSCELQDFDCLVDCNLYSLQKGCVMTGKVTPIGAICKNLLDTACIIKELDLVISVDTSVAHLAGAMGKPTWLILPYMPDWRWGHAGESTHWYRSMRIFRQAKMGDWKTVFENIAGEINDKQVK